MDLVPQTAEILKNDGKEEFYARLHQAGGVTGKTGLRLLTKGAADADKPFSGGFIVPFWHFHHPWSHRGYLVGNSSADQAAWLFTFALDLWQKKREEQALYHLGRALHLVQDIFIPQHAAVTAFKGHSELEHWLSENWEDYRVDSGGFITGSAPSTIFRAIATPSARNGRMIGSNMAVTYRSSGSTGISPAAFTTKRPFTGSPG